MSARELAQRYLQAQVQPSQQGAALVEVEGGSEPPFLTCYFHAWDPRPRPATLDTYADKLAKLAV